MSTIERYTESSSMSGLSVRTSKALSRQLAQVRAGSAIQQARIEAKVENYGRVMEGVTALTGMGQEHIVMVAQREQQLAQSAPLASGRLDLLGSQHALMVAGILLDARMQLGRLT